MEETTNVQETGNTASEVQETAANSPGSENKNELEKKFTQADVDRIVRERLKRKEQSEENKSNEEIQQREAELSKKESRLACKEYLLDSKYPTELLDVIDTTNFDDFKNKVEKVRSAFASMKPHTAPPLFRQSDFSGDDAGVAFGNTKHTPRKF